MTDHNSSATHTADHTPEPHAPESGNYASNQYAKPEQTPVSAGRRGFLRAASSVAVLGLLAGCTGNGNDGSDGSGTDGPSSVDEWLSETGNYDTVHDLTGQSTVTVEVGAQGNAGSNAFAPAAIRISPGTTVTWTWVNGYHNVVATDGAFDSGSAEQNATFTHTFDASGTFYYYCKPHRSMGMKGAVVVEAQGDDASMQRARR